MSGDDDRRVGVGRGTPTCGGSKASSTRCWWTTATDLVLSGRKRFVEAGGRRRRRAGERRRAGRAHAGARGRGCAGAHRRARSQHRPRSPIRAISGSIGCGSRASAVVGEVGGAAADIERQCRLALALQVAETVGSRRPRCTSATVEYLRDRWSFGRPLASYQALKHRVADMLLMLETAKGCAEAAAGRGGHRRVRRRDARRQRREGVRRPGVDRDPERMRADSTVASAMTWEHDLHLYKRRAAVNRAQYGAPEYHEERLCALLEMGAV